MTSVGIAPYVLSISGLIMSRYCVAKSAMIIALSIVWNGSNSLRRIDVVGTEKGKTMTELKPCPFCGSTKLKLNSKQTKAGYTGIDALVQQETYSVRCNVCHARGGSAGGKVIRSHLHIYQNNMPKWATTAEELKRKAIEAWNRRADDGDQ